MAYRIEFDMALREFAVVRAIDELSRVKETFNADDIANYIGCGVATVYRTLPKLIKSKTITRIGDNPFQGFRYEVNKDAIAG